MRKALLATFLLSPVLLSAQANSPAPSQVALAARPASPAELGAAADRGTATNKPLRISTGVIAPKLIHSVSVNSDATRPWTDVATNKSVTVGMIIDQTGKPTDLKIIKSAGPVVDHNVLEAVIQYRFQPGTVSNQPIDFPLNLEINLTAAR